MKENTANAAALAALAFLTFSAAAFADDGPGTHFVPAKGTANVVSVQPSRSNAEKFTVAFLGGSITEMSGFRPRVMKALREKHPDCDFTEIAAGLSSTCSDAGAFRLQKDVFSKGIPDLFIVEAAVNDDQDGHFTRERSVRGMEGIVRRVLAENPSCAVVVAMMVNVSQYRQIMQGKTPLHYAAHAQVARHYAAATADVGAALVKSAREGALSWKEYRDCHPSPQGCDLGAEVVMRAVEKVFDPRAKRKAVALPAPLDGKSYFNARFVDAGEVKLGKGWNHSVPDWKNIPGSKRGYFTVGKSFWTDTPGSELELEFTGNAVAAFLTAGPDAGGIEVSVDGGEFRKQSLRANYGSLHYPYLHMLAEGLPDAPHTLRVRSTGVVRKGALCGSVRIFRLGVNGKARNSR